MTRHSARPGGTGQGRSRWQPSLKQPWDGGIEDPERTKEGKQQILDRDNFYINLQQHEAQ